MTTAHRPTWKAAVGQSNEGGWTAGGAVSHQSSVLDAPAHTQLKLRAGANKNNNNTKEARLQESLRLLREAEEATKQSAVAIGKRPINPEIEEQSQLRLLKQTAEVDIEKIKKKYDDSDVEDEGGGGGSSEEESDLDAPDDSDLDSENDSDDDDDDDEAALQAELAKIRAERAEAKQLAEAIQAAQEESQLEDAAAFGNPLLNSTTSSAAGNATTTAITGGRLKRRWNDDVVFRNQAKSEPAPKKRFINDTVRNDFHKRFLNKFIR